MTRPAPVRAIIAELRELDPELTPASDEEVWQMAKLAAQAADQEYHDGDEDPLGSLTQQQFARWVVLVRLLRDAPSPTDSPV